MPKIKFKKDQWMELVAILFSLTALVISGFSLLIGKQQHQDESTTVEGSAIWIILPPDSDINHYKRGLRSCSYL
ncbi:MAG: hypothetical protein KDC57_13610 [Saprospiraceae bacterium]|nr:hypothetical protein [Saprospiraceae bacterium]